MREPQTKDEKFVFEHNDVVVYMNWVRTKTNIKLVKELTKVIVDRDSDAVANVYDILIEQQKQAGFVPLKDGDINRYLCSRDYYRQIIDPTKPKIQSELYQADRLGNLIPVKTTSLEGIVLRQIPDRTIAKNDRLTDVGEFCEGLAKVSVKQRYGYIREDGSIAIEPQFFDAGDFSDGLTWFETRIDGENKSGYIDKNGRIVIQPIFSRAFDFCEGYARVVFDFNFAYINKKGEFVIEPKPGQLIHFFSEGLAVFEQQKDKFGYINKKGEVVIEPIYSGCEEFRVGVAKVFLNGNKMHINYKGEQIK